MGTLAAGALLPLDDETDTILIYADTLVCGLFLLDFLLTLYRSQHRMRYVATWGWIDLLSSIPIVGSLRIGRAARAMRILRVIRGVKSARAIAHFLVAKRAESAFLATVLLALLVLVFSSISILQFELPGGGNIQTAEDAMWWAATTITTVGYGDTFPVTFLGRVTAVFVMFAGVGIIGSLASILASVLVPPPKEQEEATAEVPTTAPASDAVASQLDNIRAELAALRESLADRPSTSLD